MTMSDPHAADIGKLAAALAKAQAVFPAIVRDKEVDSRSYKFKYAPLDKIIEGVRPALADNGLAFTQILDGPDLVTMLLHESGGTLYGRMPLPHGNGETIQQLGSAITYLRRYALQAILGIAAEEDDDGDAAGKVKAGAKADAAVARQGIVSAPADPNAGLLGTPKASGSDDFELHLTPDGHALPFRLSEGGRAGIKVVAHTPLAELIAANRPAIEGHLATAWGTFEDKSFVNGDGKTITYRVLNLARIKVGALDLTPPEEPEPETADDFDAGWLDKVPA